jgi:hypothetical protein
MPNQYVQRNNWKHSNVEPCPEIKTVSFKIHFAKLSLELNQRRCESMPLHHYPIHRWHRQYNEKKSGGHIKKPSNCESQIPLVAAPIKLNQTLDMKSQ